MTISQRTFAENTAARFDSSSGRNTPLSTSLKLEEFDKNEHVGDWPFRELVGCLMWLTNQTRPDIANTTGYCERVEIRKSAQGGTLEDSDWYFRECLFYK